MAKYRGGVIGLGWMGLLYDLANRIGDRFHVDDIDRPTPELDVHRKFHHYESPGVEGNPTSYAEAIVDRAEVDLVSAADRDVKRLKAFSERYGLDAVYADRPTEMFNKENLDIVAVATNTKGRADLVVMAVEHGAKGVVTDKPMCHTLEEADRTGRGLRRRRRAPSPAARFATTHPSFERAKQLVTSGEIGDVISIEAGGPTSQHQNWSYFLDSPPAWVIGANDTPRAESGQRRVPGPWDVGRGRTERSCISVKAHRACGSRGQKASSASLSDSPGRRVGGCPRTSRRRGQRVPKQRTGDAVRRSAVHPARTGRSTR